MAEMTNRNDGVKPEFTDRVFGTFEEAREAALDTGSGIGEITYLSNQPIARYKLIEQCDDPVVQDYLRPTFELLEDLELAAGEYPHDELDETTDMAAFNALRHRVQTFGSVVLGFLYTPTTAK